MAARTRPPRARQARQEPADDRPHPSPHEILLLHLIASQRRDALLRKAHALQAAGKTTAADVAIEQARAIQERLTALEHEVRPRHPHSGAAS